MALEQEYIDALIVVAILLGSIIVFGSLLTLLCQRYYRPGRCLFMSKREDDHGNPMVERQGTSEGEAATGGASNNGFQPTEGGIGNQDGGSGTDAEQTTRTRTEEAEGEQGETKAVLDEQVVVEIDAAASNKN